LVEDARDVRAVHEHAGESRNVQLTVVDLIQIELEPIGAAVKPDHPTVVPQAAERGLKQLAADRVEHQVGAAPIGEFEHRLADVARGGVDELLNAVGLAPTGDDRLCATPARTSPSPGSGTGSERTANDSAGGPLAWITTASISCCSSLWDISLLLKFGTGHSLVTATS
jgi:hypothetical protein